MVAKVTSIINMKGGVGKTTIAVNLAYALFKYNNKKVLLVDIDPQFNATQYMISIDRYIEHIKEPKKCTMYDILRTPVIEAPSIVQNDKQTVGVIEPNKNNCIMTYETNNTARIDLLPSHLNLVKIEPNCGSENRLNNFLSKIKRYYDYIIIDCPPTMSFFTMSAFVASDSYIIPLRPDYLSRMGLPLITSTIKQYESDLGKKINSLGIMFNAVDGRYNLHKRVMQQVISDGQYKCFHKVIPTNIQVSELVSTNILVFKYKRTENVAKAIKSLANEYIKKVGG